MRCLIMADGKVGVHIMEWILQNYKADIELVIVKEKNIIYELCCRMSVNVYVFQSEKVLLEYFKGNKFRFTIGFLIWWPFILTKRILNELNLPFYNTHPSYLPYNRGKHYNFWAIVEEAPFGVSIHKVDEGIDSGEIIAQQRIAVNWEDTGETLYNKAQEEIVTLFKNVYERKRKGPIKAIVQDRNIGSYHNAYEINAASMIDLEKEYKARDLLNLIRARTFLGKPACYFFENGERFDVRISIEKAQNDKDDLI